MNFRSILTPVVPQGSTFLVTGGAGYIGAHVVELLVASGNNVRVLDNLNAGDTRRLDLSRVSLIQGDIRSIDDLEKAMKDVKIVFHLAALKSVEKSVKNSVE